MCKAVTAHTVLRAEGKKEGSEVWLGCIFYSGETFQRGALTKNSVNGAGNLKVPLQKKKGHVGWGWQEGDKSEWGRGKGEGNPFVKEKKGQQFLDPTLPTRRDASPVYTLQSWSYMQCFISYLYVLSYDSTYKCPFIDFVCVLVAVWCVLKCDLRICTLHLRLFWLFRAFHRAKQTSRFLWLLCYFYLLKCHGNVGSDCNDL